MASPRCLWSVCAAAVAAARPAWEPRAARGEARHVHQPRGGSRWRRMWVGQRLRGAPTRWLGAVGFRSRGVNGVRWATRRRARPTTALSDVLYLQFCASVSSNLKACLSRFVHWARHSKAQLECQWLKSAVPPTARHAPVHRRGTGHGGVQPAGSADRTRVTRLCLWHSRGTWDVAAGSMPASVRRPISLSPV